jgi:cbb3-type cytochrome oxidase cytochrome c subunit
MLKQQEETAKKRKAEMDVFIAYLSKIGKIIK